MGWRFWGAPDASQDSNDSTLGRPDAVGRPAAGRSRSRGGGVFRATAGERDGFEPERAARFPAGLVAPQRNPHQAGKLAGRPGHNHAPAERGPVRPPPERASRGLLARADSAARWRDRRTARRVVRDAAPGPARLGAGPAASLPPAQGQSRRRSGLVPVPRLAAPALSWYMC